MNLAVPLILSTGTWSVQQFIDRMFLTWYSPAAIAASMPANMVNFTLVSFFMGTAAYADTFVAQYYGANRHHRIGPAVWQGIWVSVIGGFCLALLYLPAPYIFSLTAHHPDIQALEVSYFRILCLGSFPPIAAAALAGFFAGRGRPWPVMWVNVGATLVNILLNYLLVFGRWGFPEMGINGAGLATVTAGVFTLVVYLALMLRPEYNREFKTISGWRPQKDLLLRVIRYGLPMGAQFFLDMLGFTLFILIIGRLGPDSLAATNIAFNINMLAFMPMLGSGMAISVLVGRYLGGDRPDLALKSTWSGFHLTLIYMLTISATYVLIPWVFIAPFAARADTDNFDRIFRMTVILLRFVAVFGLFDTFNIVFSSAIKGAGDTRFVMTVMAVLSLLGLAAPTYLAVVVFKWGLMGTWVIVTVHITLLGLVFFLRFLGGKWKSMRVIESAT